MNKQEKKELTLEQKIKGDLMEIKKFTYNELEKGYRGIVDRFGDFYALDEIGNIDPIHQKMVPSYLKDNDIDIIEKFQNLDLDEKTKKIYYLRNGIPDYRAMIIDVLGYCNYDAYPSSDFAVIEVPNPKINNYQITKEQQNTLIKLVKLNKNSTKSLNPIFSANQSLLMQIYKMENFSDVSINAKVKQKKIGDK